MTICSKIKGRMNLIYFYLFFQIWALIKLDCNDKVLLNKMLGNYYWVLLKLLRVDFFPSRVEFESREFLLVNYITFYRTSESSRVWLIQFFTRQFQETDSLTSTRVFRSIGLEGHQIVTFLFIYIAIVFPEHGHDHRFSSYLKSRFWPKLVNYRRLIVVIIHNSISNLSFEEIVDNIKNYSFES